MKLLKFCGLALVISSAFAACGGDDDDGGDGNGGGDTPAATAPSGGGDATENVVITAQDFSFDADTLAVAKGSEVSVTFNNEGSATHTVNFYEDEGYETAIEGAESGRTSGGDSAEFSFTAPADGGAMYYRCEVHPSQMEGEMALN